MKEMPRSRCALIVILIAPLLSNVVISDSVISTREVKLLPWGDFEDSTQWQISTTKGFTEDIADYTQGIVADGGLSFTHSRPDNFAEQISWATQSDTGSDPTLGAPDGSYDPSSGPDISSSGYQFTGLHGFEIENVSLILHFSIPDSLHQDEVNILMRNHGPDRLLATYVNTLGPVHRMDNPLVVSLDDYLEWNWSDLEDTKFTVDYVSDNIGQDDSEVRVDAVGLWVKFHQPWFSFENAKATSTAGEFSSPVLDFGPYDGEIEGLAQLSCGLSPAAGMNGSWTFEVEAPPGQALGRIHTYGVAEHYILAIDPESESEWRGHKSGDPLIPDSSRQTIRIIIQEGCISGARVDINDPKLQITGSVIGNVSGLDLDFSSIRFGVGEYLVHSEKMEIGSFSASIPIGHALPEEGGTLELGIASRFQWSSQGFAETVVVQIDSIGISGGFEIEWDRDPECITFDDLQIMEDSGGTMISLASMCNDDFTPGNLLTVNSTSSDSSVIETYGEGGNLVISPVKDAFGTATISLEVIDQSGNSWFGGFSVSVESVPDPPVFGGLPPIAYIELGESATYALSVSDPDTEITEIHTSKSWATFKDGELIIEPVSTGTHQVHVTASDGTYNTSISIEVQVTAKPDLIVETLEARRDGAVVDSFIVGDVIEIVGFIRNEGRGDAYNVVFHCMVEGTLIGDGRVESIGPGELKMAICDFQLGEPGERLEIKLEIDATDSVEETGEENNILSISILVESKDSSPSGGTLDDVVTIMSILVIFGSIFLIRMGPMRLKREFGGRK